MQEVLSDRFVMLEFILEERYDERETRMASLHTMLHIRDKTHAKLLEILPVIRQDLDLRLSHNDLEYFNINSAQKRKIN